jgi:hypothetical protein
MIIQHVWGRLARAEVPINVTTVILHEHRRRSRHKAKRDLRRCRIGPRTQ